MDNAVVDLIIIGGGINGTGIAADAAGRGLSVILCEQNDLASATSSASSKLIHGGLRYLEKYDFGLVRKALKEREILLKKAPHLISPLEFILPYGKHIRPAWLVRLGLFIYDHLAKHPSLPNSKKIDLTKDIRGKEILPDCKIGFSYFDCYDDDARLVLANAKAASNNNANILTRTECLSAFFNNDLWQLELKDKTTGRIYTQTARVLVNAAGPWIASVQENIIDINNPFTIELVQGSHLVVPKFYDGDFAYILQNPDDRVVFAIPYEENFTLIGTTDTPFTGNPAAVKPLPEEIQYLCETINHYFKKSLHPNDVVWAYAGIRALQCDYSTKLSEITRDYRFQFLEDSRLLTVISGKITTYRRLAEEAVDSLRNIFPQMGNAWTASTPLPGGDIPKSDFKLFLATFKNAHPWLPERLATRLAKSYGSLATDLLKGANSLEDLGIAFGAGLYQREIEYLMDQEWAKTTDDILWRRTKLGLFFDKNQIERLNEWLTQ